MKVSKEFILREIAGDYILVPTGEAAKNLYGIISLTESGKMLWQMLEQERTEEELIEAVLELYEIDRETAKADVEKFLEKLKRENLLML